jgi:thiamine pyrophosphate-dependent acetolactate synthase large subunit-like protein
VALARSLGAAGVRVEREGDVREALAAVALMKGPVVVDVNSDPFEEPPSGRRNRNLMELGTDPAGRSR